MHALYQNSSPRGSSRAAALWRRLGIKMGLIDLAEVMGEEELRRCFLVARRKGLLDLEELAAARARTEWRPSLAMLDRLLAELT